jgi:Tol biopolymer transport system component
VPHCYNCHTFQENNPGNFFFHVRGKDGGMVFVREGQVRKINTLQSPIEHPLAFASWHPDGVHIVSSANDEYGIFLLSAARQADFEAVHTRGDLVIYNVETNNLSTSPQVFENGYIQTHPCWSADGKYVFYIRSRRQPSKAYQDVDQSRFDLMRISYDVASDKWGTPEMLLECSKEGKSCTFPRPSSDGKYVLCALCDKTTFAIYQDHSDVCLVDLELKTWRRLDVLDSDFVKSFPTWSSNGRWITFTSRRRDDLTALPYFAYFDTHGREHKAFVLPQEDPRFYDTFTDTCNAARLVNGKVTIDQFTLAEALQQPSIPAHFPNPPYVAPHSAPGPAGH